MKKESRKKAKAEDVKICGLCGQMIIGDYEMVRTRRRTTMYFAKGCDAGRQAAMKNVIRSIRKGSAQWNEEDRLKIATLLLKAGYSVRIGRQQTESTGGKKQMEYTVEYWEEEK